MQAADRVIQWGITPQDLECERGTGMRESMQRVWLGYQYRMFNPLKLFIDDSAPYVQQLEQAKLSRLKDSQIQMS